MRRLLFLFACSIVLLTTFAQTTFEKVADNAYVVNYQSVDQFGDTLIVSGKMMIPTDRQAKNIILLPHYTMTANDEVPSCNKKPVESWICDSKGYILLMPDYVGYGVSRDRIHPYLHHISHAQNTVDLYYATLPFLKENGLLPENDSLIVMGYSQGGSTAIATLRLLETAYPEIPVKQCYASSGPYDVATTYDVSARDGKIGFALCIPLLVIGTSETYNLQLDPAYFFTPTLLKHYEEWIMSQKYSFLNVALIKMPCKRVRHWMTAEGCDKTKPETMRFYEGLLHNSIVHVPLGTDSVVKSANWIPKTPIFLMHSTHDNVVPFENAQSLMYYFKQVGVEQLIETHFDNYGSHLKCAIQFYKTIATRL